MTQQQEQATVAGLGRSSSSIGTMLLQRVSQQCEQLQAKNQLQPPSRAFGQWPQGSPPQQQQQQLLLNLK